MILKLCWDWIRSLVNLFVCVCAYVCVLGVVLGCVRLYPVGTTVQRYPIKDIVLQNYHVPAGVSDQTVTGPNSHIHWYIQYCSWLHCGWRRSIFPSDDGPGLSLPPWKECRSVWGSTALWPWPVGEQRGRPKRRGDRVSLPGVWVRGEAVCRAEDCWERDAAFAHACEWQQTTEGWWRRSER